MDDFMVNFIKYWTVIFFVYVFVKAIYMKLHGRPYIFPVNKNEMEDKNGTN